MSASHFNQLGANHEQEAADIRELMDGIQQASERFYPAPAEKFMLSYSSTYVGKLHLPMLPNAPNVAISSGISDGRQFVGQEPHYSAVTTMQWATKRYSLSLSLQRDLTTGDVTQHVDMGRFWFAEGVTYEDVLESGEQVSSLNFGVDHIEITDSAWVADVMQYACTTLAVLPQLETSQP